MKLSDILRSNLLYGFLSEKELLDIVDSNTQRFSIVNAFADESELGYIMLAPKKNGVGDDKSNLKTIRCVQEYFTKDPSCKKKLKKINIDNYYSCAKVKKALGIEINDLDTSLPGNKSAKVNPCIHCHCRAIELMQNGKLNKVKK